MRAVILCAGNSTRTYPLTISKPKPLLQVLDKTILEHNLDNLIGLVDKVLIVVGYKAHSIQAKIGYEYQGMDIDYIFQKERLGTGHALQTTKSKLKNSSGFLYLLGDNIYSRKDLKNMVIGGHIAVLTDFRKPLDKHGIVHSKSMTTMVEKITEPKGEKRTYYCDTGCYLFDKNIFNYKSNYATEMINQYAKDHSVYNINSMGGWLPITYWWDYLEVNIELLKQRKMSAYIGENVDIKRTAYMRTPYIIFNNCKIGGEVYDTLIMENTTAKHHCYLAHSVIGSNCNIGANTITADYRHDGEKITTYINDKRVQSQRKKLGACLGNHVKTAINTSIDIGRKLYDYSFTYPNEVVEKDITERDWRKKT